MSIPGYPYESLATCSKKFRVGHITSSQRREHRDAFVGVAINASLQLLPTEIAMYDLPDDTNPMQWSSTLCPPNVCQRNVSSVQCSQWYHHTNLSVHNTPKPPLLVSVTHHALIIQGRVNVQPEAFRHSCELKQSRPWS